jgi:hypothetical protein
MDRDVEVAGAYHQTDCLTVIHTRLGIRWVSGRELAMVRRYQLQSYIDRNVSGEKYTREYLLSSQNMLDTVR